jgi:hypothetical protein
LRVLDNSSYPWARTESSSDESRSEHVPVEQGVRGVTREQEASSDGFGQQVEVVRGRTRRHVGQCAQRESIGGQAECCMPTGSGIQEPYCFRNTPIASSITCASLLFSSSRAWSMLLKAQVPPAEVLSTTSRDRFLSRNRDIDYNGFRRCWIVGNQGMSDMASRMHHKLGFESTRPPRWGGHLR